LTGAKLGEGKFEENEEANPLVPDGKDGGDEGENEKCREKLGYMRRNRSEEEGERKSYAGIKGVGGKR